MVAMGICRYQRKPRNSHRSVASEGIDVGVQKKEVSGVFRLVVSQVTEPLVEAAVYRLPTIKMIATEVQVANLQNERNKECM